jgi:hypothetical protein
MSRREFYIHGSVHRNSVLIRFNKTQQYAGVYLLQNHSTCFGCISHPSSGVHQTVTELLVQVIVYEQKPSSIVVFRPLDRVKEWGKRENFLKDLILTA